MADKTSRRAQDPRRPERGPPSRPARGPGPPPGGQGGPPPFRIGPLSWLILGLLIIWNAWALMPHESAQVPLPYSEFVSQVASGNVTTVNVTGADITGIFAHPVTWPPPKAQPGPKPPQPGPKPPQPGSKSQQPAAKPQPQQPQPMAKPQRYARFGTTYPSEVGDTALM